MRLQHISKFCTRQDDARVWQHKLIFIVYALFLFLFLWLCNGTLPLSGPLHCKDREKGGRWKRGSKSEGGTGSRFGLEVRQRGRDCPVSHAPLAVLNILVFVSVPEQGFCLL